MTKVLYAVIAYLAFLATALWAVAWVGDFLAPKTIDSGAPVDPASALLVDLPLLALFAVQHSVMARPAFKRVWARLVPPAIERATYVLASSVALLVLFAAWRPIPIVVWDVGPSTAARGAAWALYALGWVLVVASTFMIDHAHLLGLAQAWSALRARAEVEPSFRVVLLYRFVRHPLMVGFLVAFWATPRMTVGHLVFALATTGYVVVGVRLEEKDLERALGDGYRRYQKEVPMLVPRVTPAPRRVDEPPC